MCFSGWGTCPVLCPGHWLHRLDKPPEQPKQWGSAPCSCTHQTWQETKERNQQRCFASFHTLFGGYSIIWIIKKKKKGIDTFPCLMSYKYIHNLHSPPFWNICSTELVMMHDLWSHKILPMFEIVFFVLMACGLNRSLTRVCFCAENSEVKLKELQASLSGLVLSDSDVVSLVSLLRDKSPNALDNWYKVRR